MIKYYQYGASKKMVSIFFEDRLFKDKNNILKIIIEILKLFDVNNLQVNCDFFVQNDHRFLDEIECLVGDKAKIHAKNNKQPESNKILISFKGVLLDKVLELGIKYEESLGINCLNESEDTLVEISLYDNDGTCINFNSEKYDIERIKDKINQIID